MTDTVADAARRRFLALAAAGSAAVAAGGALPRRALAQERVDPASDLARQLAYVEDAGQVDAEAYPSYEDGQVCANCQLYNAEQAADGWGPCAAFGNSLVAAGGWCSAWVERA